MDATARHVYVRPPDLSFRDALGQQPGQAPIDVALAQAQHRLVTAALRAAGLAVTELPAAPGHPDACFVQDIALLLPGLAILARPAEASRQVEVDLFRPFLPSGMAVFTIEAPGTLEWGDVLRIGDTLYAGQSGRTNAAGAGQVAAAVQPLGLRVELLPVPRGLHLLSGVNSLGRGPAGDAEREVLVAWPDYAGLPQFSDCDVIVVPEEEAPAANCLALGATVLAPTGYPRTAAQIWQRGYRVLSVPLSEYAKADGGMTCLCVLG